MTTDRDLDRITKAWLADGPDELSDRVIDAAVDQIHLTRQRRAFGVSWRLSSMTTPARLATAAVIGVLVVGGSLLILDRPGQPPAGAPSASPPATVATTPPPTPAASVVSIPALTKLITSWRHGYSVAVPSDWTLTPATSTWTTGIDTLYDDPGLDKLGNAQVRLAIASRPLGTQTPQAWLAPYCRSGTTKTACGRRIAIGDQTGYVDEDGKSAEGGTVETGGVIFDAAVTSGGRGYIFIMDGHVDDALFEAVLKTVTFDAAPAIDLPPLTGTFTSSRHGYSIGTADGWSTTPATKPWTGFDSSPPASDQVMVSGTDTIIRGASQDLPKGMTFDAWLDGAFQTALEARPTGCSGGDSAGDSAPFPAIQIGRETGQLQKLCDVTSAYVEVGGRIYRFDWLNGNSTASHLGIESWKELLKSVTFDPGAAH